MAGFQYARGRKRIGNGQVEQRRKQQGKKGYRKGGGPVADLRKPLPPENIPEKLAYRNNHHGKAKEHSHDKRKYQVMRRYGDDEPRKKEKPVDSAGYPVNRVYHLLARPEGDRFRVALTEGISFQKVLQVPYGMLLQVRHVQQVGQYVVAVKAHERVHIEQHRRDRADDEHVVAERTGRATAQVRPQDKRHRGYKELEEHSRGPHKGAVPLLAERPARRGIHIRQRRKEHEHHAQRMDLAAIFLDDARMPELVEQLHEHGTHVHPPNVRRSQEPRALVLECVEVLDTVLDGDNDRRKPHQHHRRTEQDADQPP